MIAPNKPHTIAADEYLRLFDGRPDFYAIRFETKDKAFYVPSNYTSDDPDKEWLVNKVQDAVKDIGTHEYNETSIEAHLNGDYLLGVYPIHADSTVRFFALDFDGDDPDEALAATIKQYEIFVNEAKLRDIYIERSRSGKGFHLWGFLDAPINAGILRHALNPYIEKADVYDRMFPNQDALPPDGYGNLIALPLFGNADQGCTRFYDVVDGELKKANQGKFLANIERIPAARILELSETAPEPYDEPEHHVRTERELVECSDDVRDKLRGCDWLRWCYDGPEEVTETAWWIVAGQMAQLDRGRELFHEWSKRDRKRYKVKDTDDKFDRACKENKPQTHRYIWDNLKTIGGPKCECTVIHPFDLARDDDEDEIELIWLSDVEPEDIDFLWEPYIARGKFTLFSGDPDAGKTYIVLDLAARISKGDVWPIGDGRFEPGKVIIFTAEDGIADTIRKRISKMDADVSRIAVTSGAKKRNGKPAGFITLDDIDVIEKLIAKHNPIAVIIDPLFNYMPGTDTHKDNDVRAVLTPLVDVAARYGCAILGIRHLIKKGSGMRSEHLGMGSIAYTAMARSELLAGVNKDTGKRVMVHTKCNIAKKGPAIEYSIDDSGVFRWEGTSDMSADDIIDRGKTEGTKMDKIRDWLRNYLITGGWIDTQTIYDVAYKRFKADQRTVRKAAASITLEDDGYRVDQQGGMRGHPGEWRLTDEPAGEPPRAPNAGKSGLDADSTRDD